MLSQITKTEYYKVIDKQTLDFSKNYPQASFDSVISFVNNSFQTQEHKVRSYYTWIASTISYDLEHKNMMDVVQMFKTNTSLNSNQTAEEVFLNKKAVCEGYSKLMVEFCKASSIPCYMVCGYTKIESGEIPKMLHAWNAVKIDSAWALLDITWASGYVDMNNQFIKRFSNKYFLLKPKQFVKDHLPLDPMWQLLKTPFTKKDFEIDSLHISHAPSFNFPDSIKIYRGQPLKQQQYLDVLHYYQTEPNNPIFARNLDVFNGNLITSKINVGVLYQNDFMELAQKKISKKPTLSDCKKAKMMLDSAQVYYTKAQNILTLKKPITEEFRAIFDSMQITLNNNFKNIKLNNEYIYKTKMHLTKK